MVRDPGQRDNRAGEWGGSGGWLRKQHFVGIAMTWANNVKPLDGLRKGSGGLWLLERHGHMKHFLLVCQVTWFT